MASDLVREMLDDLRTPLYRNAFYLIANTVLVAGAGFLFWWIVTQVYPEEEAGLAFVLVGVASFVAALATLGFGVGLIRFLPTTQADRRRMVNSCLTVSTLVALALALGLLTTVDVWSPEARATAGLGPLVPLFLGLAVLGVASPLVDNVFVAGRRASYVLVRSTLYQGVRLLLPALLVGVLGVLGVLAALVSGHVVALVVAFALLLPRLLPGFRPAPAVDRPVLNDILHFSLGNHVAEVLHVLPYPVLLVLIPRLTGRPELAAFFAVPWLIASLLFAVPLMASVSLFAEGSHFENSLRRDLRRTLRFVLPLLALGILFLWFLGEWVLGLFGVAYAAEGHGLLRILALSGVFVAVNGLFVSVARVLKWVRALVVLWTFVALGTIALAVWLLPLQGLEGVGLAWLAANGVAAVGVSAAYLWRRRSLREILPWRTGDD